MLPESAQSVIGQPHPTGRAALRMLEKEGFSWDNYVDIFDGGPTVVSKTDRIKSIRSSDWHRFAGTLEDGEASELLVAHGRLENFVSCYAAGQVDGDGAIRLDHEAVEMLGIEPGDNVLAVARR